MMQELMSGFCGYLVPFLNRELWTYGYIDLRMKSVSQPSYPHFSDIANPWSMIHRVFDFINNLWVYPIEQAHKDRLAGFPYDSEDCGSNKKADERVCHWIAHPNSNCSEKHCQTGQAVYTGVMTISDESRTADLFANLYAKLCYRLIAEKTNRRCNDHCPEMRYCLWVEEAINGYVTGDNGTK